jgi:putative oxidoreductase
MPPAENSTMPDRIYMRTFPFLALPTALLLLRGTLALCFAAHAVTRLVIDTTPQFAMFLGSQGWPQPLLLVYLISIGEIVSAACLLSGKFLRCACAFLMFIAFMGIVLIPARLGWFVGEFGTGGMEYSVLLIVALGVVAADAAVFKDLSNGSQSSNWS